MSKREKKVIISGVTTEQMDGAMADYASADTQLAKIDAKLNTDITRLREAVASRVAELNSRKDKAFEIIQTYAMEHRESLFKKRKSIDTIHGVYGFRTGLPRLATLKGFKWDGVLNLVKQYAPNFVRITEEVAKDKLLSDRDSEEVISILPKIGIKVVQSETFFIDLKKEEINNG